MPELPPATSATLPSSESIPGLECVSSSGSRLSSATPSGSRGGREGWGGVEPRMWEEMRDSMLAPVVGGARIGQESRWERRLVIS